MKFLVARFAADIPLSQRYYTTKTQIGTRRHMMKLIYLKRNR